ncbi:MAG: hypothetical protein ACAI25_05115 [Planctomycetota bacterium]
MHRATAAATAAGKSARTMGSGSSFRIFMKKSMLDFAWNGFLPASSW